MSLYTESFVYCVDIQRRQGEWLCIYKHVDMPTIVEYLYTIFDRGTAHGQILRVYKIDTLSRYQASRDKLLMTQVNKAQVCIYVQQPQAEVPDELLRVGVFYPLFLSQWTARTMLRYRFQNL